MNTIYDLKDLVELADSHYNYLLSIEHDEIKEGLDPNPDTIRRFNALSFAISNACDLLRKGLDGEF